MMLKQFLVLVPTGGSPTGIQKYNHECSEIQKINNVNVTSFDGVFVFSPGLGLTRRIILLASPMG